MQKSLQNKGIRDRLLQKFPGADITFAPDLPRARIVDSWPGDIDDFPARRDWNWKPGYEVDRAFDEYLIPTITHHYRKS